MLGWHARWGPPLLLKPGLRPPPQVGLLLVVPPQRLPGGSHLAKGSTAPTVQQPPPAVTRPEPESHPLPTAQPCPLLPLPQGTSGLPPRASVASGLEGNGHHLYGLITANDHRPFAGTTHTKVTGPWPEQEGTGPADAYPHGNSRDASQELGDASGSPATGGGREVSYRLPSPPGRPPESSGRCLRPAVPTQRPPDMCGRGGPPVWWDPPLPLTHGSSARARDGLRTPEPSS